MSIDTEHFKNMLVKEVSMLESELATLGRKNPKNLSDWEAVETDGEEDHAEEGDVADDIEQYETNSAELDQLEIQLNQVKSALEKIKNGSYGLCEVCKKPIELDRLEANPSAKTCKEHMNS